MNSLILEFLTRKECHICHEARPRVERAARRARLELRIVDIESDDMLLGRYGMRIPVVLGSDGSVVAEGELGSTSEISKAVRAWKRGRMSRPRLLRRLR